MSDRSSPSGIITGVKGVLAIVATAVGTTAAATATGSFVPSSGPNCRIGDVISLSPRANLTASISCDGAAFVPASGLIAVRFVNVGASTSQAAVTFDAICQKGARVDLPTPFNPQTVTNGAVSSWLRVALGTITGSGYSSIPDVLNNNLPTVQTIDARRPVAATSANGLPILTCTDDALQVPLGPQNNNSTLWGFACWLRQTGGTFPTLISIDSRAGAGASASKVLIAPGAADPTRASVDVFNSISTAERDGFVNGVLLSSKWVFLTVELNLATGNNEASRAVITINGSVQTLTFTGALPSMPVLMATPTGFANLFSQNAATGSNPFVGNVGPNIYFMNAAMPGATEGLLTTAARLALMNFEAPQ